MGKLKVFQGAPGLHPRAQRMWHRKEPLSGAEQGIIKNKVVLEELQVGNAGMLPAAIQGWPSPALSSGKSNRGLRSTGMEGKSHCTQSSSP